MNRFTERNGKKLKEMEIYRNRKKQIFKETERNGKNHKETKRTVSTTKRTVSTAKRTVSTTRTTAT